MSFCFFIMSLAQITGFSAQDEDQRLIIAMHSICNQDLSFTMRQEDYDFVIVEGNGFAFN